MTLKVIAITIFISVIIQSLSKEIKNLSKVFKKKPIESLILIGVIILLINLI